MLIKKPGDISENEITPERHFLNRRAFMRAGVLAASVVATGTLYRGLNRPRRSVSNQPKLANLVQPAATTNPSLAGAFRTDEPQTPLEAVTHYNNFYEFSTDKEGVAPAAEGFVARPWRVEVGGLCA